MALNYDLTEEQNLTRQAVRDFAEKEIAPLASNWMKKRNSRYPHSKDGELGLLGCIVPEKYGGSDMGYIAYIIAVEELARVDGSQAATIAGEFSRDRADLLFWQRKAEERMAAQTLFRKVAGRFSGLRSPMPDQTRGLTDAR